MTGLTERMRWYLKYRENGFNEDDEGEVSIRKRPSASDVKQFGKALTYSRKKLLAEARRKRQAREDERFVP